MLLRAALTAFRRGDALPPTEVSRSVTVEFAHLVAYNKVCGFRLRDELPVTYPHVLGFGLQMELMTGAGFPFPLPGLVHVANRITQQEPLQIGSPLSMRVHAENLRPHPHGTQFDVVTSVSDVWQGVSTYLRRGPGTSSAADQVTRPPATAVWRVPGDIGRRYGAVSGDRNPIHLHPLSARLFGFRRAIAHGMWTKARCLAALEGRLPAACTVDVQFKAPILLPAKVDFTATESPTGWTFGVWNQHKDRPHLLGSVA